MTTDPLRVQQLLDEIERLRAQVAEGRELLAATRDFPNVFVDDRTPGERRFAAEQLVGRIDAYLAKTGRVSDGTDEPVC